MSQFILFFLGMILFFGLMLAYAYLTTSYRDRLRAKVRLRQYKERQLKFKRIKETMRKGREKIKAKYAKIEERRLQIKAELKRIKSRNLESIA